MRYSYRALDPNGKEVQGVLDAPNYKQAVLDLKGQSFFVMKIEEMNLDKLSSSSSDKRDILPRLKRFASELRWVRARELVFFFRQTALMLRSGIPLLRSLEISRIQTTNKRLKEVYTRIIARIENGGVFSEGLALEKKYFPEICPRLVESSEASGEMEETLEQVANHIERRAELKSTLLTSLLYPGMVMLVATGLFIFLVTKIIPKFAKFFETRQMVLPPSTKFLLDLAAFFNRNWPFILLAILGTIIALVFSYSKPRGRLWMDTYVLKIPVIGKLLTSHEMAQAARTLSILLKSGIPLLQSLRILRGVVKNSGLRERVDYAANRVLEGDEFSGSLKNDLIPIIFTQVAAVGEQTGNLDNVLNELGEFYERDLQVWIKRMSAVFEPTMLLLVGGVVGFVYYAFFQAVIQIARGG